MFRLSNDARVSPVRLTNSLGTAGPPRQSGGDTAQDGQDACHHQCHHLFPSGGRYCPKGAVCMFDHLISVIDFFLIPDQNYQMMQADTVNGELT